MTDHDEVMLACLIAAGLGGKPPGIADVLAGAKTLGRVNVSGALIFALRELGPEWGEEKEF
jgi:hypothetical protein